MLENSVAVVKLDAAVFAMRCVDFCSDGVVVLVGPVPVGERGRLCQEYLPASLAWEVLLFISLHCPLVVAIKHLVRHFAGNFEESRAGIFRVFPGEFYPRVNALNRARQFSSDAGIRRP